jgi:hypothetical protein
LRLRFEVDYLSRGDGRPDGPDEEEADELEEKELQLEEAEEALKVCVENGVLSTCNTRGDNWQGAP